MLPVLVAVLLAAADPAAALKELAGTWEVDAATLGGRDHLDDFAGMTLTVTGGAYTITFGPNSDRGTLSVDAAKQPHHIDITTRKDGPFKGRTLPGIFDLAGGKLTICLNSEKPDRPAAFKAEAKTPFMLLTFRRKAD